MVEGARAAVKGANGAGSVKKAPPAGAAKKSGAVQSGSYFDFLAGDNFSTPTTPVGAPSRDLYSADKKSYWYQPISLSVKPGDLDAESKGAFATNSKGEIMARQHTETKKIEVQMANGEWVSADSQVAFLREGLALERKALGKIVKDDKVSTDIRKQAEKDLAANLEIDVHLQGLEATLALAQSKGTPEDIAKFNTARTAVIGRANGISSALGQAMGKLMSKIQDERTALVAVQEQINVVNTQKLAYEKEKAKYEGIEAWENAMARKDQRRQQAKQGIMGFVQAAMSIVSMVA